MSSPSPITLHENLGKNLQCIVESIQTDLPIINVPTLENLMRASSGRKYPVLIRGGAASWVSHSKWTFDFFKRTLGDLGVECNLYSGGAIKSMALEDLIKQILDPKSPPVYLQEWWYELDAPELVGDFCVPDCFESDFSLNSLGYRNSHLWIGSADTSTPMHQDETKTDFWSYQVRGGKHWILMAPSTPVYANGQTIDLERSIKDWPGLCWSIEVREGDILYVPASWWHSTRAIEPNITLRNVFVTSDQTRQYFREIMSLPLRLALEGNELRISNPKLWHQLNAFCTRLSKLLH